MSGTDVTRSSDCEQSMKDYLVAVEAQKKEDEDNYNKSVNEWKTKKNAFQAAFSTNPQKWKQFCSDGTCDMETFFTKYPQTGINELDLQYLKTDISGCLQACLNRDDCYFCGYRNGECWIKGGSNEPNSYTYVKTNTGWKKIDNIVIHGMDVGNYPEAYNPELKNSSAQRDFNIASVDKLGRGTWYKDIKTSGWNGDMYFKNSASSYIFPDSSPVILSQVGQYPNKVKTQIPLSLVCQDCRSVMEKTQVQDSNDVKMSQFNQCIANLKDAPPAASAPPVASNDTSANKNLPQDNLANKKDDTNQQNSPTPSVSSEPSDKRIVVAAGVAISSFILTNIAVIIAIVMTRNT